MASVFANLIKMLAKQKNGAENNGTSCIAEVKDRGFDKANSNQSRVARSELKGEN